MPRKRSLELNPNRLAQEVLTGPFTIQYICEQSLSFLIYNIVFLRAMKILI